MSAWSAEQLLKGRHFPLLTPIFIMTASMLAASAPRCAVRAPVRGRRVHTSAEPINQSIRMDEKKVTDTLTVGKSDEVPKKVRGPAESSHDRELLSGRIGNSA